MRDPLASAAGSAALLIPDLGVSGAASTQSIERPGIAQARSVLSGAFALGGGIAGAGLSLFTLGSLSAPATAAGASIGGAVGSTIPDLATGLGNTLYQIPGIHEATDWLMGLLRHR